MTTDELEKLYVWSVASIRKALDRRIRDSLSDYLPIMFEGDIVDDELRKKPNRVEFRIDGPSETYRMKNQRGYRVEINALVHSTYNETDSYLHQKQTAAAIRALSSDINVFQFGYPDSNKQMVGCFQLDNQRGVLVPVTEHGQVDAHAKVQQATVEAHFVMHLDI